MSGRLFGPVPSRRLGRSLGIDLVPFKTCSYDCVYCQLGPTTCKTIERREWVPLDDILIEFRQKLATQPEQSQPDYITLSGSGEPTLYSRLDELIDGIKSMTRIPVAVLTNGSLLFDDDVRQQLSGADLVVPSLDGGTDASLCRVNRPHAGLRFEAILSGLIDFRRDFGGQYWLEVLLVDGYNTSDVQLEAIRKCVDRIRPDRVQLNTVIRPPAEDCAAVPRDRLQQIAGAFSQPTEVIADFHGETTTGGFRASRQDILSLLQRRPCSVGDIAEGLKMHRNEVLKYVEDLSAAGLIEASPGIAPLLYRIASRRPQ